MTAIKTAVDAIVGCMRDMEAIFSSDETFTDIEIPRAIIARDIIPRHAVKVEDRVTDWRRRDEDDHYEYTVTAKSATVTARTYAFMQPPTIYDPYESHDEDEEDVDKVRFEWSGYVDVDHPLASIRVSGTRANVLFVKALDRALLDSLRELGYSVTHQTIPKTRAKRS